MDVNRWWRAGPGSRSGRGGSLTKHEVWLDFELLRVDETSLRCLIPYIRVWYRFVGWEALAHVVDHLHVRGASHEAIDPMLSLHLLLKALETGEAPGSMIRTSWRAGASVLG
jgi:hypothetical protein